MGYRGAAAVVVAAGSWLPFVGQEIADTMGWGVKSHRTLTPCFASRNDPSDGAETGSAELHIAEQSRSRRAVIGDREVMRGS
jgi:hypothetical protein